MMGIYCLTNKVNNKKYIGQSTNIEERQRKYFRYNDFPNNHLENAFNKYGKENFKFEIIKICHEKYLDRFEKLFIKKYNTTNQEMGYNKESGGNLNKHLSKETKEKISESLIGHEVSNETRKKISEGNLGKTMPPESKKKISENSPKYWEGKNFSDEHKKKLSESHMGNKVSNETRKKISKSLLKDYPRIIKGGKRRDGKLNYIIMYNGKRFCESVYKERLYERWYDKYPDIELIDETVVD